MSLTVGSGGTETHDSLGQETHWHLAVLLVVVSFCTYLQLPLLASGDRLLVPSYPTVALMPLLFLAVRRHVSNADIVFLLQITFLLLLSIAFSPGYVHMREKFLSLAQFVLALSLVVLVVRLMQMLSGKPLERALLAMWVVILLGASLEVLGVIREQSDAFREWAYGTYGSLYGAELRDLSMVGWLRPRFFSEEPSHVTKFFIIVINSWLLVRVTVGKVAIVMGATALMLVIMGSPMLLVSAAMTLSILIWNQRVPLGVRLMTFVGALLVVAVIGAYFAEESYSNVASRVASIDEASPDAGDELGGDERRVILPWLTLAEVWSRWPVFGVGVGGKEVVADYRRSSTGGVRVASPRGTRGDAPTRLIGNNAFAAIGIFLGLVGGALFILLSLMQARQSGVRRVGLLALLVFLFSQLVGGIDTIRYWGFIALMWGALAVADRTAELDSHPASVRK